MKLARVLVPLAVFAGACTDDTTSPVAPSFGVVASGAQTVTTAADDGPGSLRVAIAEANADPSVRVIRLRPGLVVELRSTIVFSGTQDLAIHGR